MFEQSKSKYKPAYTAQSVFTFHTWFDFIFSIHSLNENYANLYFLIDMNWMWLQDQSSVNKLLDT